MSDPSNSTGFVFALLSMLLFGVYMVPRRYSNLPQQKFLLIMGAGTLTGCTLIGYLFGGDLNVDLHLKLLGITGGVIWGVGTLAYSTGVQMIGLSRSTPIKNTTAILGTLYGIVIFREFTTDDPMALIMAVVGSWAIVFAAIQLGKLTSLEEQDRPVPRNVFWIGVGLSLGAAFCHSLYSIPLKSALLQGLSPTAFLFYMGQGAFISLAFISMLKSRNGVPTGGKKQELGLQPFLAGVIWSAASACCNSAIGHVGIAVAWPISNLNTLVAVAYGAWFLNEVRVGEHRVDLYSGLALATVGVGLLALALGR